MMHFYLMLMTRLVSLNHPGWILRSVFLSKRHIIYISAKSTEGWVLGSNFRVAQDSYNSLWDLLMHKILVRPNHHCLSLFIHVHRLAGLTDGLKSVSPSTFQESCSPGLESLTHTWNTFPAQAEQKPSHKPGESSSFCYRTAFPLSLLQIQYKNTNRVYKNTKFQEVSYTTEKNPTMSFL